MRRWSAAAAAATLLAGCAGGERIASEEPAPPRLGWRAVATEADRARIRDWRDGFRTALARASGAGNAAAIAGEGVLLQPDAALPRVQPPPGLYRCRVTKLGARAQGMADYAAYPAFQCRISLEGDILSFTKLTGSQRPVGLLFPGDDQRLIFLGTMMLGDERRALDYGHDPERDMAGALERIGDNRWRLILPYPRWESLMDVIELVPA